MYRLQVLVNGKWRYYDPCSLNMARWKAKRELVNPNYWIVDLSTGEALK